MDVVAVDGKDGRQLVRDFRTELRVGAEGREPAQGRRQGEGHVQGGQDKKDELDAELALETMEFAGGGGGRGRRRPAPAVPARQHRRRPAGQRPGRPGQGRLPDRRRLHVEGQRRDLDARQQPEPAAVLLQRTSASTRPTTRSLYVLGDTTLWKSTNGGKRFAVGAGPRRPPGPPRPVDRPEGQPAHDHRLRRRLLRHLRPRRDLGPPEHPRARPVLPRRGGQPQAVPRLRRLAGQRQLGRADRTRSAAPAR